MQASTLNPKRNNETAPTLDLVNDALQRLGVPIRDLLADSIRESHPFLSRVLSWKFRKKIEKVERKYFSGAMNSEAFLRHKSYRLLVFQKEQRGQSFGQQN